MAFYLFPGTMYRRLFVAARENQRLSTSQLPFLDALMESYEVYQRCARQRMGFMTFIQMIPGTKMNEARKQLLFNLEFHMDTLKLALASRPTVATFDNDEHRKFPEFYLFRKYSYLLPLYSFLNFGPVFNLLEDIAVGFKRFNIKINEKKPWFLIANTLPIVRDILIINSEENLAIYDTKKITFAAIPLILINVLHSFLNPARFVDQFLDFLQQVINRLLDIGSERHTNSSLFRLILKSNLNLLFGTIRAPIKITMHAINLLYQIPLETIIEPIAHFVKSYQSKNDRLFFATVKEFRDAKELRRMAKERKNVSYSEISKKLNCTTDYFGITKTDLYSEKSKNNSAIGLLEANKLVAIRAYEEKILSTASLVSLAKSKISKNVSVSMLGMWGTKTNEYDADTIELAKQYLNKSKNR